METIQQQQIEILGITRSDIQEIFTKTLAEFKETKTRIIFLDASYLYNFHLDDFETIRKINLLGRYSQRAVLEWHRMLERWYSDQTVVLGCRQIKPIQIERTFDRIVNEGMEAVAGCITGEDEMSFVFRGIGDGVSVTALPSDRALSNEVNRIDVTENIEGGSMSRDGSTIYSIGNHSKSIPDAQLTEVGMFSEALPATDIMFEHSVFITPITHNQDEDAPGSTTVIYMCSS